MDERDFFDRLAPTWDEHEKLSTPARVNFILNLIGITRGMSVLDLGTGTGVLLPYIAERVGPRGAITAVDYSEGMLGRARGKYAGLTPGPCFENLDFETQTVSGVYDLIMLYCVYPHLHTPVDTLRWLRAVNLADGGRIVIAFPCGPDFINGVHRHRHSRSDVLEPAPVLAESLRLYGLDASVLAADSVSYIVSISK